MKVLFLRFSSLGDVLLTMPAAKALKQKMPGVTVDLATKLEYKGLFVPPSPFDKVIYLDDKGILPFIKKINEQNYDIIFDLHRSIRTNIIMPFLNTALRKRYKKGALSRRLFARTGIRVSSFPTVLERYTGIFDVKGLPDTPWLPISGKDMQTGRYILRDAGAGMDRVIGMAAGAKWNTKKWGIIRYKELAERLEQRGYHVVFIFGKGDEKDREELLSVSPHSKLIDTSDYLLREVAYALSVMDAFVSGDTGLMHLAEAAGTPLVAMFGPTVREFGFFPSSPKSIVLERSIPCRPCSLHGSDRCRYVHHKCMKDISVEDVESAVLKLIVQASPKYTAEAARFVK